MYAIRSYYGNGVTIVNTADPLCPTCANGNYGMVNALGTGPIPSSQRALDKAGWKVEDLDLIEANEAFAAQAISVNREMGWDTRNNFV